MSDYQNIIKRYNDLLEEYGDSPKALGWTKDKEYLRFHVLCSDFDLNGAEIIDFGCGFGYLYPFLKKHFDNFKYIGIDINDDLLKIAREKFPDADFRCLDLLTSDEILSPDYILSSGVHNIRLTNNDTFNELTISKFSQLAKKGFAINFLSDRVEFKSEQSYHNSPSRILDLCLKQSRRVLLRNDYMPFEFTAIVHKEDQFDQATVFERYRHYIRSVESWAK